MRREVIFLILLISTANAVYADSSITIPADFLMKVTKQIEIKTETNFIQRLLINQIVNNTTVNGVPLKDIKDLNSASLMDIFAANSVFKKVSDTKLIEPNTGAMLLFDSSDGCSGDNCTITLDFNGDKGPNELWVDSETPKDRIQFTVKKDENQGLTIILPEYIK